MCVCHNSSSSICSPTNLALLTLCTISSPSLMVLISWNFDFLLRQNLTKLVLEAFNDSLFARNQSATFNRSFSVDVMSDWISDEEL